MINYNFKCADCGNKEICKYVLKAGDLKLFLTKDDLEIKYPFSIDIDCKHFKQVIANPRTRTEGV